MKLLVIDNYDSFTYNLVQYFGELGAEVLVKRNDQITVEEVRALQPDRICISPGAPVDLRMPAFAPRSSNNLASKFLSLASALVISASPKSLARRFRERHS